MQNLSMHIGKRIKAAMLAKGVTTSQMAQYCGVTIGAVSNWFSSGRVSKDNLVKAAVLLNMSPEELITGEPQEPLEYRLAKQMNLTTTQVLALVGNMVQPIGDYKDKAMSRYLPGSPSNQAPALIWRARADIDLIEDVYPSEFSIPLLSWVRAGEFCEAPGNFTREDAQELLPRPLARTGPNTFALTVVGDSMDVPDGYREGEIVYIDPDIEPTPGKAVLAKADGKMTLKRYKVDDEGPYLLQLNGNRIIRPTGEWHVCGVVIFAGRRC